MGPISFEFESVLPAPRAELWAVLATMPGVNSELWPLARMSAPRHFRETPIHQWPTGEFLFHSTIFFALIFPADRHHFRMQTVSDCGFQEDSTSLMNRSWRHSRQLETLTTENGEATRVIDRVSYESRAGNLLGRLMLPTYRLVFWNRHRRLRKKWRK